MIAMFAVLLGILLTLLLLRRGGAGALSSDVPLQWWALGLGIISVAALAVGLSASAHPNDTGFILNLISMAFSAAAILVAATALRRGRRHWATWIGLAAGLAVVLFWVWFASGYILGGA